MNNSNYFYGQEGSRYFINVINYQDVIKNYRYALKFYFNNKYYFLSDLENFSRFVLKYFKFFSNFDSLLFNDNLISQEDILNYCLYYYYGLGNGLGRLSFSYLLLGISYSLYEAISKKHVEGFSNSIYALFLNWYRIDQLYTKKYIKS